MQIGSKEISRIKMVALTKGEIPNITWYSPIKYNKKSDQFIINGMINRFAKTKESTQTNKIHFYNNITRELIQEIIR